MPVQLSFAETKWVGTSDDDFKIPGDHASGLLDEAPAFEIGAIPDDQWSAIMSAHARGFRGADEEAQYLRDTLALGLRNWRNVNDKEGNPEPFTAARGRASSKCVDRIMRDWMKAFTINSQIIIYNTVKRAEQGNS